MSEQENNTEVKGQSWVTIVLDMLVLCAIMGAIAFLCDRGKKAFERPAPHDNIMSLVRKNELDEQFHNEKFEKELVASIKKDADFINCVDGNDITPLMRVCFANYNDADIDAKVDLERLYYLRAFLDQPGINVFAKDKNGFNALHWAAWSGLGRVGVVLLSKGFDINEPEGNGFTPLMLSSLRGNVQMTEALLSLGADPSLKNKAGKTALQLAEEHMNSYAKLRSSLYMLLYSETRDKSHAQTVELLKNGTPTRSMEQMVKYVMLNKDAYKQLFAQTAAQKKEQAKADKDMNAEEKQAAKDDKTSFYTNWIALGEAQEQIDAKNAAPAVEAPPATEEAPAVEEAPATEEAPAVEEAPAA